MIEVAIPKSTRMVNHQALADGLGKMTVIVGQIADIGVPDCCLIWNFDLMETHKLTNLIPNALATIVAAGACNDSRSDHAQEDHPTRDDANWRVHSLARVNGRAVALDTRPVHLKPLTLPEEGGIDMKKIAPKARVY